MQRAVLQVVGSFAGAQHSMSGRVASPTRAEPKSNKPLFTANPLTELWLWPACNGLGRQHVASDVHRQGSSAAGCSAYVGGRLTIMASAAASGRMWVVRRVSAKARAMFLFLVVRAALGCLRAGWALRAPRVSTAAGGRGKQVD